MRPTAASVPLCSFLRRATRELATEVRRTRDVSLTVSTYHRVGFGSVPRAQTQDRTRRRATARRRFFSPPPSIRRRLPLRAPRQTGWSTAKSDEPFGSVEQPVRLISPRSQVGSVFDPKRGLSLPVRRANSCQSPKRVSPVLNRAYRRVGTSRVSERKSIGTGQIQPSMRCWTPSAGPYTRMGSAPRRRAAPPQPK